MLSTEFAALTANSLKGKSATAVQQIWIELGNTIESGDTKPVLTKKILAEIVVRKAADANAANAAELARTNNLGASNRGTPPPKKMKFGNGFSTPGRGPTAAIPPIFADSYLIVEDEKISSSPASQIKSLKSTTAKKLGAGNLIYVHDNEAEVFAFYKLISQANGEVIFERASVVPSSSKLGATYTISSEAAVHAFSQETEEYYRESRWTRLGVDWNQVTSTAKSVTFVGTNSAPVLPSSSSLSSSMASGAAQAQLSLIDALATSTDAAAKSKTPAGKGLTKAAAGALSADPEAVLSTGNITVVHSLLVASAGECEMWGFKTFGAQFQPCEVPLLIHSWSAINILACVPLYDVYGPRQAQSIVESFIHYEDKIKPLTVDTELIGSDHARLGGCLSQFCMILDKIFRLHDQIKTALKEAISRTVTFARTKRGSDDERTATMFKHCAAEFQRAIGNVYRVATGKPNPNMLELVAAIELIPVCGSDTQFLWDIQSIMLGGKDTGAPTTAVGAAKKKVGTKGAARPAVVSPTLAANPTPVAAVSAKKICGFWNSVAGCTKTTTECTYAHRKAAGGTDSVDLDTFFASPRNKNRVRRV